MENHVGGVVDTQDGTAPGLRAVLDAPTRDAIREANLAFLSLLARTRAEPTGVAGYGLDAAVAAAAACLDPGARRAVCALPFTLFNLRFEDAGFWQAIVRDAGRPGSASLADEATFARTAVFLAWHLVQGEDLAPAMVLGMGARCMEAWRHLPLSAIDHAATRARPVLEARWARHGRFWPLLVASGRLRGRHDQVALRDLGLQLLAAQGLAPAPSDRN